MAVPSIMEDTEYEAVQMLLKAHSPAPSAPHVVSGPTSLGKPLGGVPPRA
jgi:site-specific DNA recombinase